MKNMSRIISLVCCMLVLITACKHQQRIRYATRHFQLSLSNDGQVESFVDLRNSINYADTSDMKFCVLRLRKEDAGITSNKMVQKGNTLTFTFPETPVTVKLRITNKKSYLVFDVVDISGGDFYSLQFARVPLTIDYEKDDFAACAMSRKLNTKTLDYPGKSDLLGGQCFSGLGYEGAGVYLLGMPEVQLRETMKKVADTYISGEMPVNHAGGPYAMDHPQNYRSYIINSVLITEHQVDEWAAHLSRFGINQIDFHQGTTFRQGDFHFNETVYPNGVSDFRKTSEAFHRHGFMTGLHTYAQFLSGASKYVTPVPHKDLDVMRTFTLANDLGTDEQTIPVVESTANVSEITGTFVRNSKVIRIDDELMLFEKPARLAPFGFASCKRGAFGTKVSAHEKGASVEHLTQMFQLFAPKKDSELYLEIARETARAYNEGGFDMIYLDALDGTYTLVDDRELTWYYEALFVNEILKHTTTPPVLEYSTFSPSLWYGRSRMGAWDAPHRGYKYFFDKHIETNRNRADRVYLPGQMGWLALCPSRGDNVDNFQFNIFFREDVEYLGAKILAYNYGLSFLDIQARDAQPFAYYNGGILKNYDSLRQAGHFSVETLQQLRDPNTHFLLQHSENDWYLTVANYSYTLLRTDDPREFTYHNPYSEQTPIIRIEHRHQPAAYHSPGSIDLLTFDETQPAQPLTIREFKPTIDLSNHLGMGIWVYGDGGGQRINIRIESPYYLVSGFIDHILFVDFTGWRYFALAEADNGRADLMQTNSLSSIGTIYQDLRERVHFNSISKISLQVKGDPTQLRFRTIRALPLTETCLVDPELQANGQKITFRGKIKNGHFMEYTSGERAVVYDAVGNEVSEMLPDAPSLALAKGDNTLRFSGVNESGNSTAVRITLRTHDDKRFR